MKNNNIVIGIEGLVGAGKTSICRNLLDKIPNSVLLHGGNVYRAIVYALMTSQSDLSKLKQNLVNIDIKEIMDKLKIKIKLENKETVIYIHDKLIKEDDLQSEQSSLGVSVISSVVDNTKLYEFGRKLVDSFKTNYNIIFSSRDIIKMYPDTDYHFFITASIDERVKRKFKQYGGRVNEEELREHILKRDELQEKAGYYKIYPITQKIDVTDCKTVEESTNKVLQFIKVPELV